ncbi:MULTISPECIES: hypothetical protein [unclassified Polaromonas]|uniref:hypothetical protein n=1 Tax=unclassified Polaromonas TaxID=2638319 RepID=UPI000F07AC15|nr:MULTISPECIES: hypothetical protein [unclassified Polaromonas]AYQ27595.1 hypothetical protein DT070_05860 [Polaromonas sp. SP1]QGJ17562.1 hypothetical protein F7R28_03580 [Polaromonas sp. Pch-P]
MKASLKNAGPDVDERKKALLEDLIAEGERFIETSKQFPAMNREAVTSKLSLQVSGRRIGGVLKKLGIGVVISLLVGITWKFLSQVFGT